MNISLALRKVRFEKKMKQKDVARKAKITASFLSQLELGQKNPPKKIVDRLCKIYGVPFIIIAWYGTEEKDIQPNKKQAFGLLKTPMDNLISEFIK